MSRSVLIVSYYFPPLGLGGVTRALTLCKRLPSFGWNPGVLTVKPVLYRAYEPELLDNVDSRSIYRSGSRDPQRLLYLLGLRRVTASTISSARVASSRFFPDSKIGWVKPAVRLGRTLMENNRYSTVISSSPPISAHLVAKSLADEFSVPWLADFRDYWTAYKIDKSYDKESMRQRGTELLDEIERKSAAITAVNDTVGSYVRASYTIPNGYDDDLAKLWQPLPETDNVTIGLLGHLHDPEMLKPLIEVLVGLRKLRPNDFAKVRILQVGQTDSESVTRMFAKHDLSHILKLHGRLPRREMITVLSGAAVFYVGVDDPAYLPGRTFDMLASGRPLFVCAPENSEYRKLIDRTGNGCCFGKDSIERGVTYLSEFAESLIHGTAVITPRPDYAVPFSGSAMAGRFAELLEKVR